MFIADSYKIIHDSEEYGLDEEMVNKLDSMLTDYNVNHFFSLPKESDMEADETASLIVYYDSKDDVTFFLVYALWCKVYRNAEDSLIHKAMLEHV